MIFIVGIEYFNYFLTNRAESAIFGHACERSVRKSVTLRTEC